METIGHMTPELIEKLPEYTEQTYSEVSAALRIKTNV